MPLKHRLPLLFFLSFFILVFSVDAVHVPSPAHARRSLAFKKKSHRQLDLNNVIPSIVIPDVLLGSGTTTPGSTSSSSTPPGTTSPTTNPSTLPTSTDPPSTSTTPSSSDTPSTTSPTPTSTPPVEPCGPVGIALGLCSSNSSPPASTSTPPSSSPPSTSDPPSSSTPTSTPTSTSTPSTTDPGSSSPSSSPTTDTPTSTPPTTTPPSSSPSPTSSIPPNCLVDLLGNCILSTSSPPVSSTSDTPATTSTTPTPSSSPSSSPTDSPTSPPQQSTPTSSIPQTSSSDTPTPTSTPDCPLGVVVAGVCILPSTSPPPASSSNPPSTSEPPPSTSPPSTTPDPGQTSSSPSPTTPNPGSSSSPTPTPTSSLPVDPCGPVGIALGLCSSNSSPPASTSSLTSSPPLSPSPNPSDSSSPPPPSLTSATSSQPPSQSTGSCGEVESALGLCPTSSLPLGSPSSSPPATFTPSSTTTPDSETQEPSRTVPSSGTLSGTQSQPSLSSGQSSSPSGVPTGLSGSLSGSSSGSSSSPIPVISFPSGTNNNVSLTPSFSLTPTNDRPSPTITPPPQTQLSFVTESSLLLAPSVTSSLSDTLSDPDAAPPTLTLATSSNSPPTITPIDLPPNLPARIYPSEPADTSNLSGYTLVSILFQASLSWPFVAGNSQVQGQIFLYFPLILENSLGISASEVITFALQVFVPEGYQSPQDVDMLLTTFLVYIPKEQVNVLASLIKVQSSIFYKGLPAPYSTLAAQIDASFSVNSVQDPNVVPGTTSSATPSGNKSRTDAIIGVTSALGGLALGALGVLVYRSVKRSRDLRHRRLADPNAPNVAYPDRTGRDFDQDSIGGQRRRSFYFAEDSLRGQEAVQQTAVPVAQPQGQQAVQPVSQVEYSYRTSPDGVRERRAPVVTGAISAPILTQSSLNW